MEDKDFENQLLKADYEASEQENAELKAENERLKDIIKSISKPVLLPDVPIEVTNKYKQTLQEIKAIAKGIRGYLEVPTPRDVRYEMDRILNLITKAEEE